MSAPSIRDPTAKQLDDELRRLGLKITPDSRAVLRRLLKDPGALQGVVRRAAARRQLDDSKLPNVDEAVDAYMQRAFSSCVDPSLLRKPSRIGRQNKVLLAYLLGRIGQEVPLQELLLINGLHSATARRLRELETEHGHFPMHVTGTGDTTAYVLAAARPDIPATAYYWLKRNIRHRRAKTITPHERLLALLSARLGKPVALDDLAYVLPKKESGGRGRARSPQLAVARRVRELREQGWQVHSGKDKTAANLASSDYILETLEQLPPYERIKASVREEVLADADHRCESCGWGPEDGRQRGKKQLEVHHKNPQRARPEDVHDKRNLRVLCNICHAGVESKLKRASNRRTRP